MFGHDIFAGPWQAQTVNVSEPVPDSASTIALPDGFAATIGADGDGANFSIYWEGMPLLSQTLPISGRLPVSLQPLKGVLLTGTATIGE
ncbi:MAG: hypothetical protein P4L46_17565 [Fimbriimonas sp.]|nr:hypothetical protein [Fimbriimonas sp.]